MQLATCRRAGEGTCIVDVRQIRDFVAVVRCSSFAAASRNLRVSQPGLGYQIKQLEEELQVQLLQRHARGVSLTRAGETFLDHAESILTEINKAKLAMAAIAQDDRQELRIGIAPSLVQALGPVLLGSTRQDKRKIRLKEGYAAELHDGLANGSLDIAVCLSEGKPPLRTIPIYSEPLYVVGPKSDLSPLRKKISVAELAALPLVVGHRAHPSRRLLEEAAAQAGVKLTVDQEIESQALLRSLVLHSGRYAAAPYGTFAEEIDNKSLSAWRIVGPEIRQSVNLVYPATASASLEGVVSGLIQSILDEAPIPCDATSLVSTAAA
jgi:LysR family nitrogen assimilation transcriptional regulator